MAAFSPRPDRLAMLLVGGVLLAVSLAAFVRETSPEWARTQEDVRALVADRLGDAAAAKLPRGLRQVWIPEVSRTDRCVTCHTAIEGGAAFATLPNPARSHPLPELIAAHPIETFGCTLCHGGQGAATTRDAAHGDVEFWDDPLLDAARAERHGLAVAELLEMRCNACHRAQEAVPGLPRIAKAKALVKAKRCQSCHTIDGKGGSTGPDLTTIGDAAPEHLRFPDVWTKPFTSLAWNVQHLMDPKSLVPTSVMEVKGGLTEDEALSLALYVRSLRRLDLPARWTPKAK